MPLVISNIIFFISYILLIGPPRAITILSQEKRFNDGVTDLSFFFITVVEYVFRSGLLLLLAVLLEELLGKYIFELYMVDYFFGVFLFIGFIHTIFYYLAFIKISTSSTKLGFKIYRFGRNMSYAMVMGMISAVATLLWQTINQVKPFSGDIVESIFLGVILLFSALGVIEAFWTKRKPPLGVSDSYSVYCSDVSNIASK